MSMDQIGLSDNPESSSPMDGVCEACQSYGPITLDMVPMGALFLGTIVQVELTGSQKPVNLCPICRDMNRRSDLRVIEGGAFYSSSGKAIGKSVSLRLNL